MGAAVSNVISPYVFPAPTRNYKPNFEDACFQSFAIPVGEDEDSRRVFGLCSHRTSAHKRFCVYSHGNAENLSMIAQFVHKKSETLKCRTFMYEFTGYGPLNDAEPSERHVYEDVEGAIRFVLANKLNEELPIILYGRSLGCAPTLYAAAKFKSVVSCVVLESPFYSIFATQIPKQVALVSKSMDMFRNYEHARGVTAPTVVVHGSADGIVPCENSAQLIKELRGAPENGVWRKVIAGAGHNDLWLANNEAELYIRDFLDVYA